MSDTLWSDVSEWNSIVDDSYPYSVLAVRSNDGTYRDHHFVQNYQWAQRALDSGKLRVLIIYLVYRENWEDDFATLTSVVGTPHANTVVMVDVESWGGQIVGDQSAGINALLRSVTRWIGDSRRAIGYGNVFDLNSLWPTKPPGLRLIVAAYGSNPDYPGKLGHQFTDGQTADHLLVPPFGYADVNSADGYTVDAFCAALGLGGQDMTQDEHNMLADLHNMVFGQQTSRVQDSQYSAAWWEYLMNVDANLWEIRQALGVLAQNPPDQWQSGVLGALSAKLDALAADLEAVKANLAPTVAQAVAAGVVDVNVTIANKTATK